MSNMVSGARRSGPRSLHSRRRPRHGRPRQVLC